MQISPQRMSTARDCSIPVGVSVERSGTVTTVILHRPAVRNCVDGPTARALHQALVAAEADEQCNVIVLYGAGGTFCAGADLKAVSVMGESELAADGGSRANPVTQVLPYSPSPSDPNRLLPTAHTADIGPMGISRLELTKPVIAAIAGHAVAGGLELACLCDLRVAEEDAVFGVFCRRFGVPLIDGGTVRLPRLIGQSRAMDMILTGRAVPAGEALSFGLANRVVPKGKARAAAEALARDIATFPQHCMRSDRWSAIHQHSKPIREALESEGKHAVEIIKRESIQGARRFASGTGRHGKFAISANTTAASSTPSQYSIVLFDLGGVVVTSPIYAILDYESSLGLPKHSINLMMGKSKHFHALERGELDLEGFIPLFEKETLERAKGVKIDARKLFDLMSQGSVRQVMLDVIRDLRSRGYICGAVTNNWKEKHVHPRGWHSTPLMTLLDDVFDVIVESAVVGRRKPDPEIWQMALDQCNVVYRKRSSEMGDRSPVKPLTAKECIFLDDLGVNLKGAQALGMTTIKVEKDYRGAIQKLAELTNVPLKEGADPEHAQLQSKL